MTPRKYAIAYCSIGLLGLITCDEAHEITYPDGNKAVAWTGIQLRFDTATLRHGGDAGKVVNVKPGDSWSAQHPRVVGYLDDMVFDAERQIKIFEYNKIKEQFQKGNNA